MASVLTGLQVRQNGHRQGGPARESAGGVASAFWGGRESPGRPRRSAEGAAARGSAASPPAFVRAAPPGACGRLPGRAGDAPGPSAAARTRVFGCPSRLRAFRRPLSPSGAVRLSLSPQSPAFDAVRYLLAGSAVTSPCARRGGDRDRDTRGCRRSGDTRGCRRSGRETPNKAWGEREPEGDCGGGGAACVRGAGVGGRIELESKRRERGQLNPASLS